MNQHYIVDQLIDRVRTIYPNIQYRYLVGTDPRNPRLKGFTNTGKDTNELFIIVREQVDYSAARGISVLFSSDNIMVSGVDTCNVKVISYDSEDYIDNIYNLIITGINQLKLRYKHEITAHI